MTPGHISAALSLLSVTMAYFVFFGNCTSIEACKARLLAPSDRALAAAKAAQSQLQADLIQACESPHLKPMFERSPCAAARLTARHLSDQDLIDADTAVLVRGHSAQINAAIVRFTTALQKKGERGGAKVAEAYSNWNKLRAARVDQILSRRATWGELNRERQRLHEELRLVVGEVFS